MMSCDVTALTCDVRPLKVALTVLRGLLDPVAFALMS